MRPGSKKRTRNTRFLFKIKQRVPSFLKQEVTVNFTPSSDAAPSILPSFNSDRRHYTPAFILPALPAERPEAQEAEHDRRVREIELSNTDLVLIQ